MLCIYKNSEEVKIIFCILFYYFSTSFTSFKKKYFYFQKNLN